MGVPERNWTGRSTTLLWVLSGVAMVGYLAVFFDRTVEIFGHLSVSNSRLLWPLLGIPA